MPLGSVINEWSLFEIAGKKLSPSRSKDAAPELTGYSAHSNEYLAESIII